MTVKAKRIKKKAVKYCDPAVCHECEYLGDGDFICWKQDEIVIADWEPTENFLMCNGRKET